MYLTAEGKTRVMQGKTPRSNMHKKGARGKNLYLTAEGKTRLMQGKTPRSNMHKKECQGQKISSNLTTEGKTRHMHA